MRDAIEMPLAGFAPMMHVKVPSIFSRTLEWNREELAFAMKPNPDLAAASIARPPRSAATVRWP